MFIKHIKNAIIAKDIQVAYAAPIAPNLGISTKHKLIFAIAPNNLVQAAYDGRFFKKIPGVCSK